MNTDGSKLLHGKGTRNVKDLAEYDHINGDMLRATVYHSAEFHALGEIVD